jgi:hypothetical protein
LALAAGDRQVGAIVRGSIERGLVLEVEPERRLFDVGDLVDCDAVRRCPVGHVDGYGDAAVGGR